MIKAEIICDSVNTAGNRLTTFVLTYPRFIHSEFMTHRMISKNSASSRAIPSKKMIQDIIDNPAMPVFWGANQSGMQAARELELHLIEECKRDWIDARDKMIVIVEVLQQFGLHKQIANRLLEPWFHMRVIASATEWENFFLQRCHKHAQPEIQALADAMLRQYVGGSDPLQLDDGEWHLPFVKVEERDLFSAVQLRYLSVARCARVSYLNFDGNSEPEKDIALFCKLEQSGHWSPFEHVAQAMRESDSGINFEDYGNFRGWKQLRKFYATENRRGDLAELLQQRITEGSKYASGDV